VERTLQPAELDPEEGLRALLGLARSQARLVAMGEIAEAVQLAHRREELRADMKPFSEVSSRDLKPLLLELAALDRRTMTALEQARRQVTAELENIRGGRRGLAAYRNRPRQVAASPRFLDIHK